eukprot:13335573-Alexandrium_andersonii.AAC.1
MSASLVGSEMCIRDRSLSSARNRRKPATPSVAAQGVGGAARSAAPPARSACLLYTSDAADDM